MIGSVVAHRHAKRPRCLADIGIGTPLPAPDH
jgi:hypothetical protein